MADLFQTPQPQQLFKEPVAYDPTANQLQAVDDTFLQTIGNRVDSDYGKLSDQYENKQISDQDFAAGVELLVGRIQQPTLKDKWTPVVGQAKYMVFSNAQKISDSKIQTGLNEGSLSPSQAIQQYKDMANAALKFNTQSSLQDAAAWNLKASAIQAALGSGSGGGRRGRPSKTSSETDSLKEAYQALRFGIEQTQQDFNLQMNSLYDRVSAGTLSSENANTLREALIGEYLSELSSFGYSQEASDYAAEVDPTDSYSFLNSQVDYIKNIMSPVPTFYRGNLVTTTPEQVGTTYSPEETITNLVGSTTVKDAPRAVSQTTQNTPVALVAPQTQYQSNPLGLGTGGSMRA